MILYSDSQNNLYRLRRVPGYSYLRKVSRRRKKVRVKVPSYYVLVFVQKAPSVPRLVSRKIKRVPKRAVPRRGVYEIPKGPAKWVSTTQWQFDLQKIYGKFDIFRSDRIRRTNKKYQGWEYALYPLHSKAIDRAMNMIGRDGKAAQESFAYLAPWKKFPAFPKSQKYIAVECFYIVEAEEAYDEDDQKERVLFFWARREYVGKLPSMKRQMKKLRQMYSEDEIEEKGFKLFSSLPIEYRQPKPVGFKEALAQLPTIVKKQYHEIESIHSDGEAYTCKVLAFVGFAFFTPKKKRKT